MVDSTETSPRRRDPRAVPVTQRISTPPPGRTLRDAYVLCDPFTSLDPEEDEAIRKDFSAVCGGDRLGPVRKAIGLAGDVPTLHLVSGHSGTGKTTELRRLTASLQGPAGDAATVVLFDAEELTALLDIELEDIVVGLLGQLLERVGAADGLGALSTLWSQRLRARFQEIQLDLPEAVAKAIPEMTRILRGADTESRKKWRGLIEPELQGLLDAINDLLARLRGSSDGPVVVIIDQLEKLDGAPPEKVRHLYLHRLPVLRAIEAHLVLTVPLFLCYENAGASLQGSFGVATRVLPMVKVRNRPAPGEPAGLAEQWPAGIAAMVDFLSKRVDFARLFEDGAASAAAIAWWSGGSIRDALRLTMAALVEVEAAPVTAHAVTRAIATRRGEFKRALSDVPIAELRHVHRHQAFSATCTPEVKTRLLRHQFVLEYQNGEPEPWHAVHPQVEAIDEVAVALAAAEPA